MTGQEQWLAANAAWIAAGLVGAGAMLGAVAVLAVRQFRKRSAAKRERRAVRFRSAVRSEAMRIAGSVRPKVEDQVDDDARTRVFQWPRAEPQADVVSTGVGRRAARDREPDGTLAVTTIIDRGAVFEALSDEAG